MEIGAIRRDGAKFYLKNDRTDIKNRANGTRFNKKWCVKCVRPIELHSEDNKIEDKTLRKRSAGDSKFVFTESTSGHAAELAHFASFVPNGCKPASTKGEQNPKILKDKSSSLKKIYDIFDEYFSVEKIEKQRKAYKFFENQGVKKVAQYKKVSEKIEEIVQKLGDDGSIEDKNKVNIDRAGSNQGSRPVNEAGPLKLEGYMLEIQGATLGANIVAISEKMEKLGEVFVEFYQKLASELTRAINQRIFDKDFIAKLRQKIDQIKQTFPRGDDCGLRMVDRVFENMFKNSNIRKRFIEIVKKYSKNIKKVANKSQKLEIKKRRHLFVFSAIYPPYQPKDYGSCVASSVLMKIWWDKLNTYMLLTQELIDTGMVNFGLIQKKLGRVDVSALNLDPDIYNNFSKCLVAAFMSLSMDRDEVEKECKRRFLLMYQKEEKLDEARVLELLDTIVENGEIFYNGAWFLNWTDEDNLKTKLRQKFDADLVERIFENLKESQPLVSGGHDYLLLSKLSGCLPNELECQDMMIDSGAGCSFQSKNFQYILNCLRCGKLDICSDGLPKLEDGQFVVSSYERISGETSKIMDQYINIIVKDISIDGEAFGIGRNGVYTFNDLNRMTSILDSIIKQAKSNINQEILSNPHKATDEEKEAALDNWNAKEKALENLKKILNDPKIREGHSFNFISGDYNFYSSKNGVLGEIANLNYQISPTENSSVFLKKPNEKTIQLRRFLFGEDSPMDDNDIFRFIFYPGFLTNYKKFS